MFYMLHVLHVSENDGIIITICAYVTQSFTPQHYHVLIWIRMGSVETTPKVWAIGRGSLPREVPNPSALPCDDRMSI